MGGGDLNLKKSWHPSTMRNMEKVWKAEQKNDQEKRRIAELQREIREERAREDIKKLAEDTGVVEKKDGMKLDWMYKGPSGAVDREEYLLGCRIDKTFEQMEQAEKPSTSASAKNSVEYDCVPPSIFSGGDEQVDMARKLQEDPLLLIKKKEMETRAQILNNPVKLRQLRDILKQSNKPRKHKKSKRSKKESRRKGRSDSDSDSSDSSGGPAAGEGEDLDALLVRKYRELKMKLRGADMADLGSSSGDDDGSSGDDGAPGEEPQGRKRRRGGDPGEDDGRPGDLSKGYGLLVPDSKKHAQRKAARPDARPGAGVPPGPRVAPPDAPKPWAKPDRKRLSEAEMESRRREMVDNAKWREAVREKNVAKYRAEDRRERLQQGRNYDADFSRKQLSYAASKSSIESRIKSKVNNIQRSERSMHENFARR
ncbi:pre-mRNA-splicing factor CWC25 homolog [Bacillus rossius redtenbacheri]|uniref:pre-mRNA-splicing factor CWC25 homolog n=1 Tax=Bacillus rossius redtenbacheri TaxID=93214 RepID=UPI002FDE23A1